jgi:predicted DNA-binding transcriptional regulator YafY
VRLTDEPFDRPSGFDLAGYWAEYLRAFDARRHQEYATVRLSPRGRQRLEHLLEPAVVRAVTQSASEPDEHGWVEARLPIESVEHAHDELLRLGVGCEVLAPAALRQRLADTAGELAERYATVR